MRKIRPILSWILVMAMLITNVDYVRATSAPNTGAEDTVAENVSAGDIVTEDTSVGDVTKGDVIEEDEQGEDVSTGGVSENDISEGDTSFIDVSGNDMVVEEPVKKADAEATADSTVLYSGSESGVNWQITSDGVLTISGTQEAGTEPIATAWLDYNNEITKVVASAKGMTSTSHWFSGLTFVTEYDFSNLDTSKVTDMSNMFQNFGDRDEIAILDVSNLNTSNVTNMSYMFSGANSYSSINLSGLDTSNVTNMEHMFSGCSSPSLDLSRLDTSNVTKMTSMFAGCNNLRNLDISKFNTSNVTSMSYMFQYCYRLTSLDLSHFDTQNVIHMSNMFRDCYSLTYLNISNWDTSNVHYMDCLFDGCSSLKTLDVSHFDTSWVSDMYCMFYGCSSLTTLDVSNFNTGKINDLRGMFYGCSSLTFLDLSNFYTSNLYYSNRMDQMFTGCTSIKQIVTFPQLDETVILPLPCMYDENGNTYENFPKSLTEGICLYALDPTAPTIETSINSYLAVYDEKTKTPIRGVEVIIDSQVYKTQSNGSIEFDGNKTIYSNVKFTKSGYETKTISLDMSNMGNKVYMTPIVDFNFSPPKAKANLKMSHSINVGGKKVKWLDLQNFEWELEFLGNKPGQELPFTIEYDDLKNTAKITFGLKNTDNILTSKRSSYEYMENLCNNSRFWKKEMEKYCKEHLFVAQSTIGVDTSSAFMGYFEMDMATGKILESGALAVLSGSGTLTWRPSIGGGLVYIKGTLTLSATGQLVLNFENDNVSFQAVISMEQGILIAGGIGTSDLHVEVGAEATLEEKLELPFKNANESIEVNASGEVYAELKIFIFKAEESKKLFELSLWPIDSKSKNSLSTSNHAFDISQMSMVSRDYNLLATTPLEDTYILKNVYPDGEAEIVELENGTLLAVWIADLGTKSDANRTTLVYSVNKGNGWSEAKAVCETGRGDFSPSLAVYGNKAVLTYTNIDTVLAEDANLTEFLDNIDIYTAVFENDAFSTPEILTETNNSIMEFNARIATNGTEKSVIWVENSNNDPFLTDGTNKIYINRFVDGIWNKELVAENLPMIPSMTVCYINNKATIAYTLDADNSVDTTKDTELYLWSDGETTRLTSDSKADSNVQFLDNKLYWTSDSEIMEMTIGDVATTTSTGISGVNDYQILQNATNRAILFVGADGFSSELYLSEEVNGTFTTPVPVTDYGNHISDYAAVYRDNGEVTTLLFEREVLNNGESIYGQTNMHMSESLAAHNLVLNEAWYNMAELTEDNKLPVNLSLYNASSEAVKSVTVTLEAGGEAIYTETVTCDLAANGVADITVNYPVTPAQMGQAITVKAVPVDFTDSSLEDNTYEITLGLADVVLKDFAINYQDGASVLTGTLTNEGYQTAGNVAFTVLEGGADGSAIHTVSCGDLAAGAEYDITYTIPADKLAFSDAFDVKYFHVLCETDNDEDAYGNNSENIAAFPVKVTGLTIDATELSMTAGSTRKLNVTVAPENALDKTVYYISDKHEVAVVLEDGTIVACAEGTATISAITSDGAFVQSCVVTVTAPTETATTYEMNTRWASLEIGDTEQLSLSDGDGNAVTGITWSSSDADVATVDANGLVTAVAVGTTYIVCTNADNSYYNVCVIHVTSKELQALVFEASSKELTEGETLQMLPAYYPTDTTTDKTLQWTSSDEAVATVSANGLVTAVAGGTTTITATAVNGITAQFKVTVNALPRYTVTFDTGLGDEPVEITDVLGGSTVTLPTQPTREGYNFKGWFTDKDGKGTEFTANTVVNEDTYLYAFWEYIDTKANVPDGLWVTEIAPQTYTGKAIKPAVQVYDGHTLLKEKVDYTISYKNNTKANDASVAKTAPTITVKGKGNYTGKETVTFQILPKDLTAEDITVAELVKAANNKVQKPVPVITYNGKKLSNKKDFTVTYPDTKADAYKAVGTYVIKVTGIGNFSGELEIPLEITDDVLMSKTKIASIAKQTYSGKAIEPEVTVTYKKETLVKGKDYTVTYKNNTEVGKATVIVTGMGDYAGSKSATFQIVGESIAKAAVNGLTNKTYNGQEQTQKLTVTLNGTTLKNDTDYEVTYTKNINAGTAQVIITGKGRYSGTIKKTFKITAYDLKADSAKLLGGVPKSLTTSYTKGGSTPAVELDFDGTALVAKKDYTISYKNNKKPASSNDAKAPMLTIKGKGNFTGSIEIPFTITTKSLTDTENPVRISVPDMAYNAKAGKFMSKPVLTDSNGKKLKAGTDYEKDIIYTKADGTVLTKADTPQVGDVIKVTITGKGYYTGTVESTYKITRASFSKANITVKAQSYTGSAITLDADDITVKVGSTELKHGVDYEIVEDSYQNNIKKGTATVTIKGMGNYGGEKTVKFKVVSKQFVWFWNLFK